MNIKLLAKFKIWISRSSSYISIANTGMILVLFLKSLNLNLGYYYIFIYILFMCILILFGYIEDKIGLFACEISERNNRNPEIQKILKIINMNNKKSK